MNNHKRARIAISVLVLVSTAFMNNRLCAQGARLIMNGANLVIADSAFLVVENPDPNAITQNGGQIISEGQYNVIKWYIGTTSGTYSIPWAYTGSLSFTTSAASGSGYFLFSTYYTGSWQNSGALPEGITNFNGTGGTDRSTFAIDRFWQINAQGYTAKPRLTNVKFTYQDAEHTAEENTIDETTLLAARWNASASTWTDMAPVGTVNTTDNTVTIAAIDPPDLFPWWTLVSPASNFYWVASTASSWSNSASWSESPGGSAGLSVPQPSDVVIFDGNGDGACSIDSDISVLSIDVRLGYAGTIHQGGSKIMTSRQATFSGGTFSGGTGQVSVGGNFTMSGANFISTADTLDVKGNFTFSSGSFQHNNGTVRLSGTTPDVPQTVTSSSGTNFRNIDVTNAAPNAGVRIESDQNLLGVLTLGAGALLDADGSSNTEIFTLVSTADDPTRDAAIAALPSGAEVQGQITVQRYMSIEGSNNTRIYRYISSPVANAPVSDIQQEIPVTGSFTGASTCSGCLTNQSMYAYSEPVTSDINSDGITDLDDGFTDFPAASNAETLQPGTGYAMFVRGNIIGSGLWDVRGPLVMANVTPLAFPVSYTSSGVEADDGWTLLGNPFPSVIDWNSNAWTKTNLEDAIYVKDNGSATGRFASWIDGLSANNGSRYIAMGQAFWVKANAASPQLLATEEVKAPRQSTIFFREETPADLVRMTLLRDDDADEAVVHFTEGASPGFEADADARKLKSESFNFATLASTEEKLSINSWAPLECWASIRLSVEDAQPGDYRLTSSALGSFTEGVKFALHDKFLNRKTTLYEGSAYDFTITDDPASNGAERFTLMLRSAGVKPVEIHVDGDRLSVAHQEGIQWYFNGEAIGGATSPVLEAAKSGLYEVVISDKECGYAGSVDLLITGAGELAEEHVRLYPNPVEDYVVIELPATLHPWHVKLVSPLGQECASMFIRQNGVFDLRDHPPGIYLVKIKGRGRNVHVRLVKR